jgi:PKD domain
MQDGVYTVRIDWNDTSTTQAISNYSKNVAVIYNDTTTGIELEHSYSAAGAYTIEVTITDASNAVGTRADNITNPTVTVIDCNGHGTVSTINSAVTAAYDCEIGYRGATCNIRNTAPVITSIARTSTEVTLLGTEVSLIVEFTDVDTTADTHLITINRGNDALVAAAAAYTSGAELTHTYNEAGTYTITVTIEDNSGAEAVHTNTVINPTVTVLNCSGNGVAQFENSIAACDCNDLHSGATCAIVCSAHGTFFSFE